MSSEQPRYELVVHPGAANEFDGIPDADRERLRGIFEEMATTRHPADVGRVEKMAGHNGLLRVSVGTYRAILAFESPQLKLVLADHREQVYDRMDVAERRRDA